MNKQTQNTEELLKQSTQRRAPLSRDQKDAIFARVRQVAAEESVQEEREERFSKWLIGLFASIFIGAAGSAAAAFFVAYQLVTTTPTDTTPQVAVEEVQDTREEVVTEVIPEETQNEEIIVPEEIEEQVQEEIKEEIIDIPVPERQKTSTYIVGYGGGLPNRADTQWDIVYQPQIDIAEASVSVQEFTAMTEQRMNEIIDLFTDSETFVRAGGLQDYLTTLTKEEKNAYGLSCMNAIQSDDSIAVCAMLGENGELSVEWANDTGIEDGITAASAYVIQFTGSTVTSTLMPSENTYTEGDSRFGLELYALTPAAYSYSGVEYQPVPWVAAVLNGRLVGLRGHIIPVNPFQTVTTISGEEALARFAANIDREGYGYIYEIENEAELVVLESVELQVLGASLEYEYFYTDSAEYLVPVFILSGVEKSSGVEFHAIVNALSPPDSLGNITANF